MMIKHIKSMTEVNANCWNRLIQSKDPFVRHEFLLALEQSESVCEQTGWLPHHLLVFQKEELIAVMPLYLKIHSRGEYVFDQQWADAYSQSGMEYYPKWVNAIPFTPCQGQRLLIKQGIDEQKIIQSCINYITELSEKNNISSLHVLFPNEQQVGLLKQQLMLREGVQFHWFNKGYIDFNDYLQSFTSRQRKKINKERRNVKDLGIQFQRLEGRNISDQQWQVFFMFYEMTYQKRGQKAYLDSNFFKQLAQTMSEQIMIVFAIKEKSYVGAALSFVGEETLYGRYWGCYQEFNNLHFETCYYQGLEYCFEQKLKRFDSGAQGEHKIARGFEPITTYSAHWILNTNFSKLINDFLRREKELIQQYKQDCFQQLPFKQNLKK